MYGAISATVANDGFDGCVVEGPEQVVDTLLGGACILACKVEISLAEYAMSEEASKHTARAFPLIDLLKRITIIIKGLYYIPHSVLGSGPMTNLIVPPFIMSSCDIQQLP